MLKLIKEHYSSIVSILFLGGNSLYCFIKGNNIYGFICLLFMFIVFQYMDIQALNKRVCELSLEICDLDKKIAKVKWVIKD